MKFNFSLRNLCIPLWVDCPEVPITEAEVVKKIRKPMYILPGDYPTSGENDILDRKPIAENIFHGINKSDSQMNFLISGKWGIGKSSVLKEIEELLDSVRIAHMRFSPWQFSSGSESKSNFIARAFLVKMAENLNKEHEINNLYIDREVKTHRNIVSQFLLWFSSILSILIFLVITFLLGYLLLMIIGKINSGVKEVILKGIRDSLSWFNTLETNQQILTITTTVGVLALPNIGKLFSSKVTQSGKLEKEIYPEQLDRTFKEILDKSTKRKLVNSIFNCLEKTFDETPLKYLGSSLTKFINQKFLRYLSWNLIKYVVFIDDLDRCNPDETKQFMAGLKTFLEDRRVYFVIAADLDEVKKWKTSNDTPSNEDLEKVNSNLITADYLKKIVQIETGIPYMDASKITKYITNIIQDAKTPEFGDTESIFNIPDLTNLCIKIATPREIKYYLRKLFSILNFYNSTEPSNKAYKLGKDETTFLFKLIILSDRHSVAYETMMKDPSKKVFYDLENDFPNYVEDEENRTFHGIKYIISQEPKSSQVNTNLLPISTAFDLVKNAQGQPTDPQQFIELAATDPAKALKFIESNVLTFPFERQIPAQLNNSRQALERYKQNLGAELALSDEELATIRFNLQTSFQVYELYGEEYKNIIERTMIPILVDGLSSSNLPIKKIDELITRRHHDTILSLTTSKNDKAALEYLNALLRNHDLLEFDDLQRLLDHLDLKTISTNNDEQHTLLTTSLTMHLLRHLGDNEVEYTKNKLKDLSKSEAAQMLILERILAIKPSDPESNQRIFLVQLMAEEKISKEKVVRLKQDLIEKQDLTSILSVIGKDEYKKILPLSDLETFLTIEYYTNPDLVDKVRILLDKIKTNYFSLGSYPEFLAGAARIVADSAVNQEVKESAMRLFLNIEENQAKMIGLPNISKASLIASLTSVEEYAIGDTKTQLGKVKSLLSEVTRKKKHNNKNKKKSIK